MWNICGGIDTEQLWWALPDTDIYERLFIHQYAYAQRTTSAEECHSPSSSA